MCNQGNYFTLATYFVFFFELRKNLYLGNMTKHCISVLITKYLLCADKVLTGHHEVKRK